MRFLIVLLTCAAALNSQPLPVAPPGQIGLGPERLARISAHLQAHVDAGHISGATALIARKGQIGYFETFGYMDRDAGKAMRPDTIFRIYSMTKAVTGVAVMMLYEEGKYFLTDPVSKVLPEFASMQVMGADGKVVPAERQMTIRDLLRHTSGLDYAGPKDEKGEPYFAKLNIAGAPNLAEAIRRMAKAPLVHQPGTKYQYGYSIDVLGRIVEAASGMTLDRFFEERIFAPLGMVDTGFWVPENKWDRLVALDTPAGAGKVRRSAAPPQENVKKKPALFLGGQGLMSTTLDYARFCQMLLNGGVLNGKRLLSRKSVELMSTDHLGDLPQIAGGGGVPRGYGFGLTFAVNLDPGRAGNIGSKGEYNWGGAAGTRFWIDPKEQMIGVFMVNILPHTNLTYGNEFKVLAYQAIVD